jgi:uncharacterized membrane protein
MRLLTVARVVAVVGAGLLAGLLLGDRAGAYYARLELSDSSFVQFQQVVHVHFARFMPPLVLTSLLAALAWLLMVRSQWRAREFWLIAASTLGIVIYGAMTRAVNLPLNDQLMTWSIAAPPGNVREIWAPWERVHTIRTSVAVVVFLLEAVALGLAASNKSLQRSS